MASFSRNLVSILGYRLLGGVFLAGVGTISALGGFAAAISFAKKSDPSAFNAGLVPTTSDSCLPHPGALPPKPGANNFCSKTSK